MRPAIPGASDGILSNRSNSSKALVKPNDGSMGVILTF